MKGRAAQRLLSPVTAATLFRKRAVGRAIEAPSPVLPFPAWSGCAIPPRQPHSVSANRVP